MPKETFALINDKDQVVNHVVVDKDGSDFETIMADQLALWGCVRYVETNIETDIIHLDESPEIWTTHTEETGFVLPVLETPQPVVSDIDMEKTWDGSKVTIKGKEYPSNSLLIKENASLRPAGWKLFDGVEEVSLSDAD